MALLKYIIVLVLQRRKLLDSSVDKITDAFLYRVDPIKAIICYH